ncbi:hypothetical protein SDC9_100230 [bioreactor metagenome]|uniref:Uncharacterized protein n=1 Tax=bioreactor metagenome TaxID=1076179 RepID=A0A645AJR8_9ZZZZ
MLIPFHLLSWSNKKLHLHLFEFTHSENKLSRNNFISKCFPDLSNSKRDFHSSCFLYIQEVYKNSLGSFWAKVDNISVFTNATHLCTEHQVELSYISPVSCSRYRTYYFTIQDELFNSLKIILFKSIIHSLRNFCNFCFVSKNIRIRLSELLVIERVSKFLASFLYLFFNLIFNLCNIVFE